MSLKSYLITVYSLDYLSFVYIHISSNKHGNIYAYEVGTPNDVSVISNNVLEMENNNAKVFNRKFKTFILVF